MAQSHVSDAAAPDQSRLRTTPGRIAAVAHLFGIDPPAVSGARVLEIDSAAAARDIAQHDLLPLGTFDFVLCHGVYSVVSANEQDALLAVMSRVLAPDGIGYLSYAVSPGHPAEPPRYFADVVEQLDAHDLLHIADARPSTMFTGEGCDESTRMLLADCQSQLEVEQTLDFARNRAYRQSLVVHAPRARQVRYDVGHDRFRRMHFAAQLPGVEDTRFDGSLQYYGVETGRQAYTNDDGVKAALDVLTERWPWTTPWTGLADAARDRLAQAGKSAPPDVQSNIDQLLRTLIMRDLIHYRLDPVEPQQNPVPRRWWQRNR